MKYLPFVVIVVAALFLFRDVKNAPYCANVMCNPSVLSMGQKFDQYTEMIAVLSFVVIAIYAVLKLLKFNTHGLIFYGIFALLAWPLIPILSSLGDLWMAVVQSPLLILPLSIIVISLYLVLKFDTRGLPFCIVVVLLFWFLEPIWSTSFALCPANCTFPAGFSCVTHNLSQSGELTLKLGQRIGHTIIVNGVYCSDNSSTPPAVIYSSGRNVTISSGNVEYVAGGTSGNVVNCPVTGGIFTGRIYANYTDLVTGQSEIITGAFNCKYET